MNKKQKHVIAAICHGIAGFASLLLVSALLPTSIPAAIIWGFSALVNFAAVVAHIPED